MGERLKSIASIQTGLFLVPLLILLWSWIIFMVGVNLYVLLTTGGMTPVTMVNFFITLAIALIVTLPTTWFEVKLVRSCFKKYDMKQVSVNLIVFLFICGFLAVQFQDYLNSLPGFLLGG